jgi:5'-nucleotidase
MKLLITNDDGIDAEGISTLTLVAKSLGEPWVIAPATPQSGCSHRVTVDEALEIEQHGTDRFAVHGTPADCVRMGLHHLFKEPTWVLSGINHGGNLGADVYYSGTVAAVREAVLHGFPGIAMSHFRRKDRPINWARAGKWIRPVIRELIDQPWTPGTFWNVNLPSLLPEHPEPQMRFCPLDPTPLPLSYRHEGNAFHYDGDYFSRTREEGCDVDICFGGDIAVTLIRLL